MEFLEALRKAWHLFGGGRFNEPWASDETAFEEHFGVSYAEFEERLASLDQANSQLYERTLQTNPEAAIVWVFYITSLE